MTLWSKHYLFTFVIFFNKSQIDLELILVKKVKYGLWIQYNIFPKWPPVARRRSCELSAPHSFQRQCYDKQKARLRVEESALSVRSLRPAPARPRIAFITLPLRWVSHLIWQIPLNTFISKISWLFLLFTFYMVFSIFFFKHLPWFFNCVCIYVCPCVCMCMCVCVDLLHPIREWGRPFCVFTLTLMWYFSYHSFFF